MQNVVSKTVIKHVTEALKLLDTMELEQKIIDVTPTEEICQLEDKRENPTIHDFIEGAIRGGLSLSELCKRVGGMYLLALLDRYEESEVRRRMGIRINKFQQLKQEAENLDA
jgi:hypothetical protein